MRHATSAGTVFFAAMLACYLHTKGCVTAAPDEPPLKAEDSNPQVSELMENVQLICRWRDLIHTSVSGTMLMTGNI